MTIVAIIFSLPLGDYCLYDGMTFPEVEATSLLGKVKKYIPFLNTAEEEKIRIPSHSQAQEDSLLVFLHSHGKKLKELNFSINSEVNFLKCVSEIFRIYEQLRCQKILKDNNPRPENRMATVNLTKVCIIMYDYVLCMYLFV